MERPYGEGERLPRRRQFLAKFVRPYVQQGGASGKENANGLQRRWRGDGFRDHGLDVQDFLRYNEKAQATCKDVRAAVRAAPEPTVEDDAVARLFFGKR